MWRRSWWLPPRRVLHSAPAESHGDRGVRSAATKWPIAATMLVEPTTADTSLVRRRTRVDPGCRPHVRRRRDRPPSRWLSRGAAMDVDDAVHYHTAQSQALAASGIELVLGSTMSSAKEAIGLATVVARMRTDYVIGYVIDEAGCLPDGTPRPDAVRAIDCLDHEAPPPAASPRSRTETTPTPCQGRRGTRRLPTRHAPRRTYLARLARFRVGRTRSRSSHTANHARSGVSVCRAPADATISKSARYADHQSPGIRSGARTRRIIEY
jgi:hypothetical protein